MTNISRLPLEQLEEAIKKERQFWFVGHDNRIFNSKINKVFCNPSSGMQLSVFDEELSKVIEGYKYLNASQIVHINQCFFLKEDAERNLYK